MAITRKTVLIVVTSCDKQRSGRKTGLWFDEFAIPYSIFKAHRHHIVVASPSGGQAPIDPQSLEESSASLIDNTIAKAALNDTQRLSEISIDSIDALYIPGGNGTMYDLYQNQALSQLLLHRHETNRLIATACHGAVCLSSLEIDGKPYVKQRKLTCFSDAEELQTGQENEYDFLLETHLRQLGAELTVCAPWHEHIVVDDRLVTGQNPQSCERLAKVIVDLLR